MSDIAGKPYQPANGTEGMIFMARYCDRCRHGELNPDGTGGCDIQLNTMIFDPSDEEYPKEWVYGQDGRPTCTAFERSTDEAA